MLRCEDDVLGVSAPMSSPCDTFIAILAAVLASYDRLRTEGKPGDVAHLSQGLKVFERGQGRSVAVLNEAHGEEHEAGDEAPAEGETEAEGAARQKRCRLLECLIFFFRYFARNLPRSHILRGEEMLCSRDLLNLEI